MNDTAIKTEGLVKYFDGRCVLDGNRDFGLWFERLYHVSFYAAENYFGNVS